MAPDIPIRSSVRSGGWVVCSGQVGALDGVLLDGIEAQANQAITNLSAALEHEGASLASVVKVNVYLTSMADYDAMNRVYAERFTAPWPARTAVAVLGLPRGALVELEAWAHPDQV